MPVPIIVITALALGLRLATGGYATIKPSLFIAVVSAAAVCLFVYSLKREIRGAVQARMFTIVVAMPLLAWSLPSLGLLFLVMCLWVSLAAGRFNQIVSVYLLSLLLLPELDDTLSVGSLKLLQFNVHNGLAIGAAVAIFLNSGKAKCRLEWDVVALSVVVLLAWALARETTISHMARVQVKVMMDLGLPYYIVSRGLREGKDIRSAMLWLGAGAVTVAAILLFELAKGWPIYNGLYWVYELPTLLLVKMRAGMLRAGGPFIESTSAALVLAICILALIIGRDQFRSRTHYFIVLTVALVGLLAPQSRGAWVGLCFAIGIADLLRRRYAQLAGKALILGGVFSALLVAAQLSPFLSQQIGLSGGASDTADYRRLLLERGFEEFLQRPFSGYSIAELQWRLVDMVQGEGIIDFVNAYIWIMLISGIGGLIIFVGAFLYFLSRIAGSGRFKERGRHDVEAGVFAFAAMAMSMEMYFFTSFATRPAIFLFVLFGFAAAFIRLQQPVKRQDAQLLDGSPNSLVAQP